MMSSLDEEFEKLQKIKDENKRICISLVGNCYQFKNIYSDKHFCYIKVISINPELEECMYINQFNISEIKYLKNNQVCFEQLTLQLEDIQNMTKITLDEFEYNVSQLLKKMNLQFIQGGLDD